MNKVKYAIIVLCAAALLLAAVIGYDYLSANYDNEVPSENASSSEAVMAPDFTVFDGEGNPVSFSDFSGKPVVINFWATWCGYCVKEMPSFEKAFEEFGDEVVFMMINVTDGYQETKEDAVKFVEEKGYTFPVYYDTELSAAGVYGASSLPATAFINADGELVHGQLGMLSEETLYGFIEKLLENKKSAPSAQT